MNIRFLLLWLLTLIGTSFSLVAMQNSQMVSVRFDSRKTLNCFLSLSSSKKLQQIDSIDLSGTDVCDNELLAIARACPQLKNLNLRGCDQLTQAYGRAIAQMHNLEFLDVGFTDDIHESIIRKGIGVVITGCLKLKHLELLPYKNVEKLKLLVFKVFKNFEV